MQLTESQVSASRLADVFNSAFMETSELDGSEFKVKVDRININVDVDDDRKWIRFSITNVLEKAPSLDHMVAVVNKINVEKMMARFYVYEYEGNIFFQADYCMTFEKGIISYHVVKNLKYFEKVVIVCFQEYLLEYC